MHRRLDPAATRCTGGWTRRRLDAPAAGPSGGWTQRRLDAPATRCSQGSVSQRKRRLQLARLTSYPWKKIGEGEIIAFFASILRFVQP